MGNFELKNQRLQFDSEDKGLFIPGIEWVGARSKLIENPSDWLVLRFVSGKSIKGCSCMYEEWKKRVQRV